MAGGSLTIENLRNVVQTGDVESFMGGASPTRLDEQRATREMRTQGMDAAPSIDGGKNFSDVLRDSVDKVNTLQHQADTAVKELVAGRSKNIHETMLAIERADASLKLMMQVRNKVLDAYKEIMRMQV